VSRAAGAALACLLIAGAALTGCGDDDGETTFPTTTPTIEPATPTGPTGAAGEQGAGAQKPGGEGGDVGLEDGTVTPPPESGTQTESGGSAAEDSAENDLPPNSEAEAAFEKYCDENPEACG
jgi:hypothetical protein